MVWPSDLSWYPSDCYRCKPVTPRENYYYYDRLPYYQVCEHPSHDVNLHHLSQTRNNRSIRRLSIEHSEYVYSVLYTALVRPVRQEASGPCPTTSCITQSSLVQMLIVHSILHRGHYLENEQDYGVNDGGVSGWRRPLRAFSLSNREWPEQHLCPVYKRTYRVRVQSMLKYAKVC